MVNYQDYVAGWLDSSVLDFLQVFPANSESMKYALITCLDSDLQPMSLLKKSPAFSFITTNAQPLGKALVVPTRSLLKTDFNQVFFGFDEIWFFPSEEIEPKPSSAWLVGRKLETQTRPQTSVTTREC